jgi:hypothetical protein
MELARYFFTYISSFTNPLPFIVFYTELNDFGRNMALTIHCVFWLER